MDLSGKATNQAQGCANAVKLSFVDEILVANSGTLQPSFPKGHDMVVAVLVLTLHIGFLGIPIFISD